MAPALVRRARHSRQAGLESQLSDLHLQTAAQQQRHQQAAHLERASVALESGGF